MYQTASQASSHLLQHLFILLYLFRQSQTFTKLAVILSEKNFMRLLILICLYNSNNILLNERIKLVKYDLII